MMSTSFLPSQFHANTSHWQGSWRNGVSRLPVPAVQRRGWQWACCGVPIDTSLKIPLQSKDLSPFSSFQIQVKTCKCVQCLSANRHQLPMQATVVCVMEFSSPGPRPSGDQGSPNLCSPLVHICTCRYACT